MVATVRTASSYISQVATVQTCPLFLFVAKSLSFIPFLVTVQHHLLFLMLLQPHPVLLSFATSSSIPFGLLLLYGVILYSLFCYSTNSSYIPFDATTSSSISSVVTTSSFITYVTTTVAIFMTLRKMSYFVRTGFRKGPLPDFLRPTS